MAWWDYNKGMEPAEHLLQPRLLSGFCRASSDDTRSYYSGCVCCLQATECLAVFFLSDYPSIWWLVGWLDGS